MHASFPSDTHARILDDEGIPTPRLINGVFVSCWGLPGGEIDSVPTALLTPIMRSNVRAVDLKDVAAALSQDDSTLIRSMLPPFGAISVSPGGMSVASDGLGFKHLFRCTGDGWEAVSTSARLLARLTGGDLDKERLLLQSQLGWQLGTGTVFQGVTAVDPGTTLRVTRAGVSARTVRADAPEPGSLTMPEAVDVASDVLREVVDDFLDRSTTPVLQLSGGWDSRLLLAAIPTTRRRGLQAVTLDNPGSRDAAVSGSIAAKFGLQHHVFRVEGLEKVAPGEWYERVRTQALLHECMADPVTRAVTSWAEESLIQGHRLSGVGGELARGYYYLGRVTPETVTRARTETIARWKMLANEAVSPDVLEHSLGQRAQAIAIDQIHTTLRTEGREWHSATDGLYQHRIRRWGGLEQGAVGFARPQWNPFLDERFVRTCMGLSPRDKSGSRFVSRLLLNLDPVLAEIPLDDRPRPRDYAHEGALSKVRLTAHDGARLARKIHQRLMRKGKPSAGSSIVAQQMALHLREHPELVDPVRNSGIFSADWLNALTRGRAIPSPASLGFLINVLTAVTDSEGQPS